MRFSLIRPCLHCPFRYDHRGYLRPDRAQEIADALLLHDQTFACHETTVSTEVEDGEEDMLVVQETEHCAGAMVFLLKQDRANQLMRIVERLGLWDAGKMDMNSPVFDTTSAMVEHHRSAWGR